MSTLWLFRQISSLRLIMPTPLRFFCVVMLQVTYTSADKKTASAANRFSTFPREQFITHIPCFEEVSDIADTFHSSDNIFEICRCILHLFELLIHHCNTSDFDVIKNDISSHNLRKIILWTENNYLKKISIDEVAAIVGYEKHYFCNKFKVLTGISYINYVNNLRIQHACRLLANGSSVSDVCNECGFENLSYFIQLFKKIVGVTPKTYSTNIYARDKWNQKSISLRNCKEKREK